jgi:type II secretory ATPase GspE/PulE/Tfp pilus assembly ATPase PilB-like protein/ActR/RegA family two-component response regulator
MIPKEQSAPAGIERRVDRDLGTGKPTGVRAFAEQLLGAGALTREQLASAVERAEQQHVALHDMVVVLGLVSEVDSYAALSKVTGIPLLDLRDVAVSGLAVRLVPEKLARRHTVLPLHEDNRTITFAVSRPLDIDIERDIGFAAGRTPRPVLMQRSQVLEGLDRYYPKMGEVERLIERLKAEAPVESPDTANAALNASPVVELCNQILAGAVQAHASDIHIEPFAGSATVRYRVSGILEQVITLPKEARSHITNRLKVLAKVNIAMKHRPQDGAFRILVNGRAVDVRLSTLPTVHGEKIVMRIVDGSSELQTLARLGYDASTEERLRRVLKRPDGLVLFSGPTASGKTTALYASVNELRDGRTNIVTVEDPVERYVEGVNQIPVNKAGGTTFAQVLRSVLRQDPNVIMVGEIRDTEVAQIAGQAAYTGHLVLSSLHTIDAPSAIGRLLNLGLEPFRVAEVLNAVFAQRLVRRLCPTCREMLDPEEARRQGAAHGIRAVAAKAGRGCERCRNTGYLDRIPVAETLVPDEPMRRLIRDSASATDLRAAMRQSGFRSMRDVALAAVADGITSLDEVNRVLTDDDEVRVQARTRHRVLIVDDDRMIRMLVKLLLEKEGYEVIEGENGLHAVELARRERPDLIVLDLMMPEMDGFEAIGRLRRELALAALPVIVLTAESGPDTERRVLELGADDYLVKPFEPGVLLSRVRATFRRAARTLA